MHRRLETYLTEISARLNSLPAKRRAEELKELRIHLDEAVMVNQALGESEPEAAAHALEQFGAPNEVSGQIVGAWRRGRSQNLRSFFSAIVFLKVIGLLSIMPFRTVYQAHPIWQFLMILSLTVTVIRCSICGYLFPKRALLASLALSFYGQIPNIVNAYGYFARNAASYSIYDADQTFPLRFLELVAFIAVPTFVGCLSAFFGSIMRARFAAPTKGIFA